jgi:hypothetical protein
LPLINAYRHFAESLSLPRATALIFLTTILFRLLLAFAVKPDFSRDTGEVTAIAISVAEQGVFGNPYKIPTGPTSHTSPGFPFLLGLIYKLWGTTQAAEIVRQTSCIAVTALQFSLLPWFASLAGVSRGAGLAAGLLGGLLPVRYWVETYCSFGEPYSGLTTLLCAAFWLWMVRRSRWTPGWGLLLGLAIGLSMYFNPAVAAIFLPLLLLGAWLPLPTLRAPALPLSRYAAGALAVIAGIALAITPWTVRNYRSFGAFMLLRGNLGLELQVSYCDLAVADTNDNIRRGVLRAHHPAGNAGEAALVRDWGEAAYFRYKMRQAVDWMQTHPGRSAQLVLERIWLFWSPQTTRLAYSATNLVLLALALAALPRLLRLTPELAWLTITALAAYPLLYYLIQSAARYRYPLEWLLYFLVMTRLIGNSPSEQAFAASNSRHQAFSLSSSQETL